MCDHAEHQITVQTGAVQHVTDVGEVFTADTVIVCVHVYTVMEVVGQVYTSPSMQYSNSWRINATQTCSVASFTCAAVDKTSSKLLYAVSNHLRGFTYLFKTETRRS